MSVNHNCEDLVSATDVSHSAGVVVAYFPYLEMELNFLQVVYGTKRVGYNEMYTLNNVTYFIG